jgi:diguanylate cyclase
MDSPSRTAGATPGAPAAATTPAQIAKGALRRLALSKLEPTPANYARCYAEESGEAPPPEHKAAAAAAETGMPAKAKPLVERLLTRACDDAALRTDILAAIGDARYDDAQRSLDRSGDANLMQGQAWAALIERLARALERGSRQWTPARKKDSLQRVLDSSRKDAQRLQQRLKQLLGTWENDTADASVEVEESADMGGTGSAGVGGDTARSPTSRVVDTATEPRAVAPDHQPKVVEALEGALRAGLPPDQPRAVELADELAALGQRIRSEGATLTITEAVVEVCQRARRLFAHRHNLVDELMALCRSLSDSITELAEDDSWARGQGQALRGRLDDNAGSRAVRAARELLADTRERQKSVRSERAKARDALKAMITHMLSEIGELGQVTGRFNDKVANYADVIEKADSIENLADVVRELVGDTRAVHEVVASARQRMAE